MEDAEREAASRCEMKCEEMMSSEKDAEEAASRRRVSRASPAFVRALGLHARSMTTDAADETMRRKCAPCAARCRIAPGD